MRFTLTEALCLFWQAWDYKTTPERKVFTQQAHEALSDLTDYIIREINFRSDAPHFIPSPLENFKALNVH